MTIVVIGKNSFLAQGIRENPGSKDWCFIHHTDIEKNPDGLKNARVVINFAFPPSFFKEEYTEGNDFDLAVARQIPENCHYIALSSRMVYGRPEEGRPFTEKAPGKPQNTYGRNKLAVETRLKESLPPEHLTILRLSNIFDFEPGRHTFFGTALTSLHNRKEIFFDIDPESPRDFLPRPWFAEILIRIAQSPKAGLYNIGSGFGTKCGDVARWLIEGYGEGELMIGKEASMAGSFILDMSHSKGAYNLSLPLPGDIRKACIECGKKLRAYAS